jgi:hypothetical protein
MLHYSFFFFPFSLDFLKMASFVVREHLPLDNVFVQNIAKRSLWQPIESQIDELN